MKITLLTLTIACAALLNAAGPIVHRNANQQSRIGQGVRSGQLTPLETARIEAQERALQRQIVRDRIDGGGLSAAERARINHRQNALSHEIYHEKHDRQVRR
ncbi:MAG: hypothetical protein HY820_00600 [Acidobacteria bacterium]|nr:hypothetical protein [Acidobacteriota bacterium]